MALQMFMIEGRGGEGKSREREREGGGDPILWTGKVLELG